MEKHGHFTYGEIVTQAEAWAEAIEVVNTKVGEFSRLWESTRPERVIFTGCGSTYYLSLAVASWFQSFTGTPCHAVPGSELWLYPKTHFTEARSVLVALSRSGKTTETQRAVSSFRELRNGPVVTIQCYPDSPLSKMGNVSLTIPSGREKSVAQTRSFDSLLVAAVALGAHIGQHTDLVREIAKLPEAGERLVRSVQPQAEEWAKSLHFDSVYMLGSGPRYGLACEAALKFKEISLTQAEPYHFLEFRHGPETMLDDRSLVIGFLSDEASDAEEAVLREVAELGAKVLVLAERPRPLEGAVSVALESNLPEAIRGVMYMPPVQLFAYELAMVKSLDPDRPRNSQAVVILDQNAKARVGSTGP